MPTNSSKNEMIPSSTYQNNEDPITDYCNYGNGESAPIMENVTNPYYNTDDFLIGDITMLEVGDYNTIPTTGLETSSLLENNYENVCDEKLSYLSCHGVDVNDIWQESNEDKEKNSTYFDFCVENLLIAPADSVEDYIENFFSSSDISNGHVYAKNLLLKLITTGTHVVSELIICRIISDAEIMNMPSFCKINTVAYVSDKMIKFLKSIIDDLDCLDDIDRRFIDADVEEGEQIGNIYSKIMDKTTLHIIQEEIEEKLTCAKHQFIDLFPKYICYLIGATSSMKKSWNSFLKMINECKVLINTIISSEKFAEKLLFTKIDDHPVMIRSKLRQQLTSLREDLFYCESTMDELEKIYSHHNVKCSPYASTIPPEIRSIMILKISMLSKSTRELVTDSTIIMNDKFQTAYMTTDQKCNFINKFIRDTRSEYEGHLLSNINAHGVSVCKKKYTANLSKINVASHNYDSIKNKGLSTPRPINDYLEEMISNGTIKEIKLLEETKLKSIMSYKIVCSLRPIIKEVSSSMADRLPSKKNNANMLKLQKMCFVKRLYKNMIKLFYERLSTFKLVKDIDRKIDEITVSIGMNLREVAKNILQSIKHENCNLDKEIVDRIKVSELDIVKLIPKRIYATLRRSIKQSFRVSNCMIYSHLEIDYAKDIINNESTRLIITDDFLATCLCERLLCKVNFSKSIEATIPVTHVVCIENVKKEILDKITTVEKKYKENFVIIKDKIIKSGYKKTKSLGIISEIRNEIIDKINEMLDIEIERKLPIIEENINNLTPILEENYHIGNISDELKKTLHNSFICHIKKGYSERSRKDRRYI